MNNLFSSPNKQELKILRNAALHERQNNIKIARRVQQNDVSDYTIHRIKDLSQSPLKYQQAPIKIPIQLAQESLSPVNTQKAMSPIRPRTAKGFPNNVIFAHFEQRYKERMRTVIQEQYQELIPNSSVIQSENIDSPHRRFDNNDDNDDLQFSALKSQSQQGIRKSRIRSGLSYGIQSPMRRPITGYSQRSQRVTPQPIRSMTEDLDEASPDLNKAQQKWQSILNNQQEQLNAIDKKLDKYEKNTIDLQEYVDDRKQNVEQVEQAEKYNIVYNAADEINNIKNKCEEMVANASQHEILDEEKQHLL